MAALVGAGTAGASNPQGADIFGVGGGHLYDNHFATFDVSAHSSPTRDFGHVGVKAEGGSLIDIYIDVDCVIAIHIVGPDSAVFVAGVVRRVSPVPNFIGAEPGDRQTVLLNDGGDPSEPMAVDALYFFQFPPGPVPNCKPLITPFLPPNVSEGNINIRNG
jgi:hypothetical protein